MSENISKSAETVNNIDWEELEQILKTDHTLDPILEEQMEDLRMQLKVEIAGNEDYDEFMD